MGGTDDRVKGTKGINHAVIAAYELHVVTVGHVERNRPLVAGPIQNRNHDRSGITREGREAIRRPGVALVVRHSNHGHWLVDTKFVGKFASRAQPLFEMMRAID